MFNHLIPLCWNTTTKLLKCRSVSKLKCFEPPSWYNIFIVPVEKQLYKPPVVWPACKFLLLWKIPTRQCYILTAAWRKLWTWPWQCVLTPGPKERQETVGCWVDWSGSWDFPTCLWMLLFQPGLWLECVSAPLHTRERGRRARGGGGGQTYCRSWRKLFRGDSLPLSWENSINYLRWQMFTDPNMHEFVELAGFPRPNVLVFTMRAEAVVILAVLQRALIWAVSTTNHFGGNYFTP